MIAYHAIHAYNAYVRSAIEPQVHVAGQHSTGTQLTYLRVFKLTFYCIPLDNHDAAQETKDR